MPQTRTKDVDKHFRQKKMPVETSLKPNEDNGNNKRLDVASRRRKK